MTENIQKITKVLKSLGEPVSDQVSKFINLILDDLYADIDFETKQDVAEKIKSWVTAPEKLVKKLAEDVDPISIPVLQNSPVLETQYLIMLLENMSKNQVKALARRANIDAPLLNSIINSGDDEVWQLLANNTGANFSANELNTIISKKPQNDTLSMLANRSEFSYSDKLSIFVNMTRKLMQLKNITESNIDPNEINKRFNDTLGETRRKLNYIEDHVSIISMIDNFKNKSNKQIIKKISYNSGVSEAIISNDIVNLNIERLTLVLKASSFNYSEIEHFFNTIYSLLTSGNKNQTRKLKICKELYQSIPDVWCKLYTLKLSKVS